MQKINREALKEALDFRKQANQNAIDRAKVAENPIMHDINLYAAAAAFLEITDPEYKGTADACDAIIDVADHRGFLDCNRDDAIAFIRAMMKELTE